jgi:O-antigen/teichoic acid export membrane protein
MAGPGRRPGNAGSSGPIERRSRPGAEIPSSASGGVKTVANAAWLTVTRLAADLLSFLLFIAIARHFGPAGTGAYSYSFAVAALVSVCGSLGLDVYGIREFARLDPAAHRPLLASLLGTQALAVAAALAGLVVYLLVSRPDAETAAAIVFLTVHLLGLAIARTLFAPAFARQAMAGPAVAELLCRGGAILTALTTMVLLHVSLVTALIAFPVAGLFLAAIAAVSAFRHVGSVAARVSWPTVRDTVRVAWPFGASDIVFQVYARADLVLLTLIAGEAAAGIYASGFKFVEVGTMPLSFLSVAAFPELSRLFESDRRGFATFANDLLRRTLFLGGLLAWVLYFCMPAVILPVFGHRFAAVVPLMRLMAGLALLFAAEIVLVRVLLAAHLQVARVRLFTIATVVNVVLNLVLIPLFRIPGAVAAWMLTLVVINVSYARAIREYVPRHGLVAAFGGYVAAVACGAGTGVMAVRYGLTGWVAAGAALVCYFLVAMAFGLIRPIRLGWRG